MLVSSDSCRYKSSLADFPLSAAGQTYVVLTNDPSGTVTDDNTLAGTHFPYFYSFSFS